MPDADMNVVEGGRNLKRRIATVFDSVAGRVGPNGFLTEEQLASSRTIPLAPEEVLLRSLHSSTKDPPELASSLGLDLGLDLGLGLDHNAESRLRGSDQALPESDLLKSIHTYVADYYARSTRDKGRNDFKSLDETALIALGILIEEAGREMLGENGDMALVEPAGLADGMPESKRTKHQIKGRVHAPRSPSYASESSEDVAASEPDEHVEEDESPKKRRRGERAFLHQ